MINRIIIAIVNLWAYVWFFRVILLNVRTCRELPNPAHPKTLNDKFLWRKLFDQNPAFGPLSDKLESKKIADARCAGTLLPEVLWTGSDARAIPDDVLAGDVIVKATHGSGFNFPIFGGTYDRDHLIRVSHEWMRRSFGRRHWEWGYFGVRPRLFVEQLILDNSGGYGTAEAKIYVYCGLIEQIVIIYDRQLESSAVVLRGHWSASTSGNTIGVPLSNRPLPHNRAAIERVARQLCEGFDHLRCDLYLVEDDIYFGEYPVYNQGGYIIVPDDPLLSRAVRCLGFVPIMVPQQSAPGAENGLRKCAAAGSVVIDPSMANPDGSAPIRGLLQQAVECPGIKPPPALLWRPHEPGLPQIPKPRISFVQAGIINPGEPSKRVKRQFGEIDFPRDRVQVAPHEVKISRQCQCCRNQRIPFRWLVHICRQHSTVKCSGVSFALRIQHTFQQPAITCPLSHEHECDFAGPTVELVLVVYGLAVIAK